MRTVYHMLLLVLLPTAFMQAEHRSADLIRTGGIGEALEIKPELEIGGPVCRRDIVGEAQRGLVDIIGEGGVQLAPLSVAVELVLENVSGLQGAGFPLVPAHLDDGVGGLAAEIEGLRGQVSLRVAFGRGGMAGISIGSRVVTDEYEVNPETFINLPDQIFPLP